MAITINNNNNPLIADIGKREIDATLITTDNANVSKYEIRRRDGQKLIEVDITDAVYPNSNILAVSSTSLQIILPHRTKFKVRTYSATTSPKWSPFTEFTTRDKKSFTPTPTNTSNTEYDTDPTFKGSKTITVVADATATVEYTAAGATVTNSKNFLNNIASVSYTGRGATITNNNS